MGEWQAPLLIGAIIVGIVFYVGRSKVPGREPSAGPEVETDPEPTPPRSGPELVAQIQDTLGIAILVDSVGSVEPCIIHATFIYGRYSTPVVVTGASEMLAWPELAKAAIAWRNSNYQHLPLWWGGGGVW